MFCDDHLPCAELKTANLDPGNEVLTDIQRVVEKIRQRWPKVQLILRGDSGFCRDELMRWCEEEGLFYVFGLARNSRLVKRIAKELKKARKRYYTHQPRQAQEIYKELRYRTLKSWSCSRRVVAKAEYLAKGDNPRFVVTNLARELIQATQLYEKVYCARGDTENRIKEQQLYVFANRTSSFTMRADQPHLYFSSIAYVLMSALRRRGLQGTEFAQAQCQSIRLKLLKIGAQVRISVRRIYVSISSAYPYQDIFCQTLTNLKGAYPQLC